MSDQRTQLSRTLAFGINRLVEAEARVSLKIEPDAMFNQFVSPKGAADTVWGQADFRMVQRCCEQRAHCLREGLLLFKGQSR